MSIWSKKTNTFPSTSIQLLWCPSDGKWELYSEGLILWEVMWNGDYQVCSKGDSVESTRMREFVHKNYAISLLFEAFLAWPDDKWCLEDTNQFFLVLGSTNDLALSFEPFFVVTTWMWVPEPSFLYEYVSPELNCLKLKLLITMRCNLGKGKTSNLWEELHTSIAQTEYVKTCWL